MPTVWVTVVTSQGPSTSELGVAGYEIKPNGVLVVTTGEGRTRHFSPQTWQAVEDDED